MWVANPVGRAGAQRDCAPAAMQCRYLSPADQQRIQYPPKAISSFQLLTLGHAACSGCRACREAVWAVQTAEWPSASGEQDLRRCNRTAGWRHAFPLPPEGSVCPCARQQKKRLCLVFCQGAAPSTAGPVRKAPRAARNHHFPFLCLRASKAQHWIARHAFPACAIQPGSLPADPRYLSLSSDSLFVRAIPLFFHMPARVFSRSKFRAG